MRGENTREREERMATQKQRAIDFIRDHVVEHGFPPTTHEIREHLGYKSLQSVHSLLATLQAEGRITKVKGRPRTIAVVEDAPPAD